MIYGTACTYLKKLLSSFSRTVHLKTPHAVRMLQFPKALSAFPSEQQSRLCLLDQLPLCSFWQLRLFSLQLRVERLWLWLHLCV